MNISPPRATAERNVDSVPNVNARMRNSGRRNIGLATRPSIATNASRQATPAHSSAITRGLPQPVWLAPYGRMPYVTETMIKIKPSANVTLPHQSTGARRGCERSSSFRYAHTVPNRPTGTEMRKTRRQSIGASRPPSTSPTNMPLTPTMLLMPSAMPRWLAGKASVMIAAAFASRNAAPMPCTTRKAIRYVGAGTTGHPVDRQQQRRDRVDDEAEVVDAHAPVHVPQATEADDQHAGDDEEAEDHPQQVEAVGGLQRVEVDAAEDRRHGDQRDRGVERRQQHAERRVRQRDPLVAVGVQARSARRSPGCSTHTTSINNIQEN